MIPVDVFFIVGQTTSHIGNTVHEYDLKIWVSDFWLNIGPQRTGECLVVRGYLPSRNEHRINPVIHKTYGLVLWATAALPPTSWFSDPNSPIDTFMRTLCGGSIESVRTSMEWRWIRAETLAPLPTGEFSLQAVTVLPLFRKEQGDWHGPRHIGPKQWTDSAGKRELFDGPIENCRPIGTFEWKDAICWWSSNKYFMNVYINVFSICC